MPADYKEIPILINTTKKQRFQITWRKPAGCLESLLFIMYVILPKTDSSIRHA